MTRETLNFENLQSPMLNYRAFNSKRVGSGTCSKKEGSRKVVLVKGKLSLIGGCQKLGWVFLSIARKTRGM